MFGRGLVALLSFIWKRKFKFATVVFGLGFVISLGWWQLGLSVSEIPLSAWVFIGVAFVTLPYAVLVSAIIVGLIYDPNRVVFSELDPANGDLAVHDVSQETYDELIAIDETGQEVGKGHLQQIDVQKAREAYEVTSYDPEANTARTSWMGNATNYEIRQFRGRLEQVQETLSPMARAYSDLHASYDMEVKERAQDTFNSLMAVLQGVELPPGMDIASQLQKDAGQEELGRLPDPEEQLNELEDPEQRESGPALVDEHEPQNGGEMK
ncbi:hypothetical protein [Halostella litorea]|uniref:hypothetical protein n=1 Tax=Halostella litorea TaxID=2528831 RepID=UPI001092273D|nr:hypothetical protein [Halostella litorea]